MSLVYASEADVLNMALFGMTAKAWREANPDEKGNILDQANASLCFGLAALRHPFGDGLRSTRPAFTPSPQAPETLINQPETPQSFNSDWDIPGRRREGEMALHPGFPDSPHAILDPEVRWFPADEALRDTTMDKLMPPLVAQLRRKVKEFRDGGYVGASETSKSLLNWWFKEPHLLPGRDAIIGNFKHYFAQREAIETIIYLHDVVGAKDKFDLMRFDSSGAVSAGMFDEGWRRPG